MHLIIFVFCFIALPLLTFFPIWIVHERFDLLQVKVWILGDKAGNQTPIRGEGRFFIVFKMQKGHVQPDHLQSADQGRSSRLKFLMGLLDGELGGGGVVAGGEDPADVGTGVGVGDEFEGGPVDGVVGLASPRNRSNSNLRGSLSRSRARACSRSESSAEISSDFCIRACKASFCCRKLPA